MIFGLVLGLGSGIIVWLNEGLINGLVVGLVFGGGVGLFVRNHSNFSCKIKPVETLKLSGRNLKKGLRKGFFVGMQIGASIVMIKAMAGWINNWIPLELSILLKWINTPVEWIYNLMLWLYLHILVFTGGQGLLQSVGDYFIQIILLLGSILMSGLVGAIIGAIVGGLSGPEIEKKIIPNHGIKLSGYNCLFFAMIGGFIGGLIVIFGNLLSAEILELVKDDKEIPKVLRDSIDYQPRWRQIGGILSANVVMGILVGALSSAFVPGLAFIQHYTVRLFLWKDRYIPLNLTSFLNQSKEKMILQRVGGVIDLYMPYYKITLLNNLKIIYVNLKVIGE